MAASRGITSDRCRKGWSPPDIVLNYISWISKADRDGAAFHRSHVSKIVRESKVKHSKVEVEVLFEVTGKDCQSKITAGLFGLIAVVRMTICRGEVHQTHNCRWVAAVFRNCARPRDLALIGRFEFDRSSLVGTAA